MNTLPSRLKVVREVYNTYTDFQKPFDKAKHILLLRELNAFGFDGTYFLS